ncbi:MAG: hypothetical protein RR496_06025 [Lachnospiraceae bacterium]
MEKEKLTQVLKALEGISYLEWKKLRHAVDRKFASASMQASNLIKLSENDAEAVVWNYEHL